MRIQKYISVILLSFLTLICQSQDYHCKIAGQDMVFKINHDKIIIKYKGTEPILKNKLLSGSDILAKKESSISSDKLVYDLDPRQTQQKVESAIEELNINENILFAAPFFDTEYGEVAISNQFIVRLKNGNDYEKFNQLCLTNNFKICDPNKNESIKSHERSTNKYLIEIPKNKILVSFEILNELQKNSLFEYIEPNFIRKLDMNTVPNDPNYSNQWALPKMNLPNAWNTTTGSSSIKIAILDCGVDLSHPDLFPNLGLGYDATWGIISACQQNTFNSGGGYENNDKHGTSCAGVAGAKGNNSIGISGAAQNCQVIPIRISRSVSTTDPFGVVTVNSFYSDDYILSSGIEWAWLNGVDIISMSWSGGPPVTAVMNAIDDAHNSGRAGKGCLVFGSTGNDNFQVKFPAKYDKVIAVGATNETDFRCTPSDWGSTAGSCFGLNLDIAAPGNNIISTDLQGTAGYNTSSGTAGNYTAYTGSTAFSGTSASCPYAAGVMGLILSINPDLTKDQARYAIESTCDKVGGYLYYNAGAYQPNGTWCNDLGHGRINAQAAVEYAQSLIPVTPPSGSPLSVSLTAATPFCWSNSPYPKLTITISGSNPIVPSSGPNHFLFRFFDDAAGTISSGDFTGGYTGFYSAPNGVPTDIQITFPYGPPSFPYINKTYYVDAWGADYVHAIVASKTITINPSPTITVGDQSVCKGTDVGLGYPSPVPYGGTPPYTYQWGPPAPNLYLTTTATGGYVTNIQTSTNYTLTVIDNNGCSGADVANIFVDELKANAGPDKEICISTTTETIGLPASPGIPPYTYSWSPATGLSSTTINNPTIVPTSAGSTTYTLTVSDAMGCTSQDNVTVIVSNVYPTANAGSDLMVCAGPDVDLTGTFTSTSGEPTLTWTNGTTNIPGTVLGSQYISTVNPMSTTTYIFTVLDPSGCSATDAMTVFINPVIGPTVNAGSDLSVCTGSPTTLNGSISGGTIPYYLTWSKPSGIISTTNPTIINPTANSTYTLNVTDANGCFAQDQLILTVSPLPDFYTTPGYIVYKCSASTPTPLNVVFPSGGASPYTYLWSPAAGLSNPSIANPIATPTTGTIYSLQVTDANGCSSLTPMGVYIAVYTGPPTVDFDVLQNCAPNLQVVNTSNNNLSAPPGVGVGGGYALWNFSAGISPSTSTSWSGCNFTTAPPGARDITLTVTTKENSSTGATTICYTVSKTKTVYVIPATTASSTLSVCGTYSGTSVANDKIANTVTVSNGCTTTINSGAQATYIGGTGAITFKPGFTAVDGSNFWAFIDELCIGRGPQTISEEEPPVENILGDAAINVYPNPNNGNFKVDFTLSEDSEKLKLTVANSMGQLISSLDIYNGDGSVKSAEVNLTGQPNGIYIVTLSGKNFMQSKRFTIVNNE